MRQHLGQAQARQLGLTDVRVAGPPLTTQGMFVYLHKKHAPLVPRRPGAAANKSRRNLRASRTRNPGKRHELAMRLRDRTSPLARRLLLYVVLFGSAVTLLLTAYQLYRDYRLDLAQIDNEFTEIERVHLRTLASALWATDKAELEVHLDGMRGIRDIEYLAVVEPGRVWAQTGAPRTENAIERRYVLRHPHRGQERQIGELVVIASLDGVYARLLDKVVVILVSNGVKTFLVATFILFLFHWLVTRHVHAVVEQTQREHMGDIALERTPHGGRRDELDDLVTALNAMRAKLTTSLAHLRDREGQLSLITDNLPGLVARVDRDLRYLFVNAQYERWFGLPPAAIIGRRVPEVIGAEAFARFEPYARRALAGERVSFESWIKVASGQVVYGQATYVPDVGPDGEVRGHFTLVTDISERRHAEQALRESEERLRLALDAAQWVHSTGTSRTAASPGRAGTKSCGVSGRANSAARTRRFPSVCTPKTCPASTPKSPAASPRANRL